MAASKRRSRMRLVAFLLIGSLATVAALPQERWPAGLSIRIDAEVWGIGDWSAVRAGQLTVSHAPGGDQLRVTSLSTDPRPAASTRVVSAVPACDGNCALVSAFDHSNANRLGGYFGVFASAPSTAVVALQGHDDGRRALTVDFAKTPDRACGVWLHLFDFTRPADDRVYMDSRPFAVVSFWIRGRTGTERMLLKVADAWWERKEDALPVGDVGSFLPAGRIETTWQRAVVPLSALPRELNRGNLAVLAFEVTSSGEGQVAIKDVAFCRSREPLPPLSPPVAVASVAAPAEKALWVWNTAEIIASDREQQALLEFARAGRFTDLFLQLPNAPAHRGPAGEVLLDADRWKPFLTLLNRSGVRGHALDGSRDDALPDQHARVLKTVDNVVGYNATAQTDERFAGIHFDVEPYLLPGFQGPRRNQLLTGYLTLVARVASRARAAGLTIGVDVPFWYDLPDEASGRLLPVEFNGTRKPASEHVLDLVDCVGVMGYRTVAYGADGVVRLAEGELAYAATQGKRVLVGLETTELPDEDLVDFDGEPGRGLPERAPADRTVVFLPGPRTATVRLVQRDGWSDLRRGWHEGESAPALWWPVRRVVGVPASKLTFAGLGADSLHKTMRQALDELQGHPAFAGFAIHDYLGYRRLLAGSAPSR